MVAKIYQRKKSTDFLAQDFQTQNTQTCWIDYR